MVNEVGDIVRDAVAHVMGEPKASAVRVNVSVPIASDSVVNVPIQVASSHQDDQVTQAAALVTAAVDAIVEKSEQPSTLFAIEDDEPRVLDVIEPDVSVSELTGIECEEVIEATPQVVQNQSSALVFDLGDLVFVQTEPQALEAAQSQPQADKTPSLRRSDLPPVEVATTDSAPLVQVETSNG